jgi:MYXO-CTERM domain-containing protein
MNDFTNIGFFYALGSCSEMYGDFGQSIHGGSPPHGLAGVVALAVAAGRRHVIQVRRLSPVTNKKGQKGMMIERGSAFTNDFVGKKSNK